jgi:hypothetical protein
VNGRLTATAAAVAAALAVPGCAPSPGPAGTDARHLGIQTRLLDGELVGFGVAMRMPATGEEISAYADCAAAQYALIRGYGFARHVRTTLDEEGGILRGDAVYTISPSLPRGLKTMDAEVVVADCVETGIPTV